MKIKINRNLLKSRILIVLMLNSAFTPALFELYTGTARLVLIIKMFCVILFLLYGMLHLSQMSKEIIWIAIYYFFSLVSTIATQSNIKNCIEHTVMTVALVVFVSYEMKNNLEVYLKLSCYYFTAVSLVNLLQIILLPDGIGVSRYGQVINIINVDNQMVLFIIMSIVHIFMYSEMFQKWNAMRYFIGILISFSCFYVHSATAMVVLTVLWTCLVIKQIFRRFTVCFWHGIAIYAGLFVCLHFSQIYMIFSGLIVNILNKTITFSGRTIIWKFAIEKMQKSFLLGYGVQDGAIKVDHLLFGNYLSAHDLILQLALEGGIIAVISFGIIIIGYVKRIDRFKKDKSVYGCMFLTIMITCSMETTNINYLIYFLTLCMYYLMPVKTVEENGKEEGIKCQEQKTLYTM